MFHGYRQFASLFLYFTYMHAYSICMSVVFTRMSSVCHSYVLLCHPYVTCIYSNAICMSTVCTRMSSVCHTYVRVSHSHILCMYSYVIRMSRIYSYVIPMSLVCIRMSSVCHSPVVLPWTIFCYSLEISINVLRFIYQSILYELICKEKRR